LTQGDLQTALSNVLTTDTAIIDQAITSFAPDKHLADEFFQLLEIAF
jgi:hypothetical protein